ncbi:2'-5' RNA ligase family protein [Frondihabitans cladoniiphilus]|uniref:2'-5' RNA ligase family protein n=1 Tax=Frondihabitans cladoniiphilus TaxID=715785 RepID=A0ABP8W0S0_9MICO
MHSLELLLDPATDRGVRDDWQALLDAGLPSQGRHQGASNAPHVTLLARPSLDDSNDTELGRALTDLPLPARLGGLVVFGRPPRGLVLARLVVVTPGILRLHAVVHEIVGDAGPDAPKESTEAWDAPHTRPGHWTPHVTLASGLSPAQLADALPLLGPADLEGAFVAGRRWDSTQKLVIALG